MATKDQASEFDVITSVADDDKLFVLDVSATALNEESAPTGTVVAITYANLKTLLDARYQTEVIAITCSDESTAIDATGTKVTFRMPYAFILSAVRASLTGACSTGTFTVDINEGGTTILSTKLTIDATEKTSTTAATAAVISDTALADDAEITIDVDDEADGSGTGLKVYLIGVRNV